MQRENLGANFLAALGAGKRRHYRLAAYGVHTVPIRSSVMRYGKREQARHGTMASGAARLAAGLQRIASGHELCPRVVRVR